MSTMKELKVKYAEQWLSSTDETIQAMVQTIKEQALTSQKNEIREKVERLRKDLPKRLPNPLYPDEGGKYLKMEGNINFLDGYNQAKTDILALLEDNQK